MSVGILIVIVVAILLLAIAWLYCNYFTKKKLIKELKNNKVEQEVMRAEPGSVTESIELVKSKSEQTLLTEESPHESNIKAAEPGQAFQVIASEEQRALDRERKQKKPTKIASDKLRYEETPTLELLEEELPEQKIVEQQPSEQTEQKSPKMSSGKKRSPKRKSPKQNPPAPEMLVESSETKIIHPLKLDIINSYISLHEAGSKNAIRALLSAGIGKLTEDSEVMEVLDEIERRVGKNVLGDDAYTSIYEYGFVNFFKKINLKMLMDYGVEGSIDQLKDETP